MKIRSQASTRGRRGAVALMIAAALTATAACGSSSGNDSSSSGSSSNPYHLIKPGTLTVGINLVDKPERYIENGKPAGYDVTLLNDLAQQMGVKLELKNLDFNGLIPGLQAKSFDMVSNGLGVTPEREKVVTFTQAYDPYQIVMAVPANSTTPATVEAWNKPGVKLVGEQGSIAAAAAAKSFPKATFKAYASNNSPLLDVASGRADGAVLESYLVVAYSQEHPSQLKALRFPSDILPTYFAAWAVQKGNTALQQYLNQFLCTKQKSGELAKIYQQQEHAPMPKMPAC